MLSPQSFVEMVADVELPSVFNPYRDICPEYDSATSARIRRQNLENFLLSAQQGEGLSVWVGRDLGYRGGRRTGVALTDELHLQELSQIYPNMPAPRKATRGPVMVEKTASVFWRMIRQIDDPLFTWNVFPFHPHEEEKPFTNRCHTGQERKFVEPLFKELLNILQPQQLIAIGNDADKAIKGLGLSCVKLRHPSYGGVSDFTKGVSDLHKMKSLSPCEPQLYLI